MGSTLLLPEIGRILAGFERRLAIIERRIRTPPTFPTETELIFSLPGVVLVSTSPKAYLRADSRLVNIVCSLGTTGTSTTTVQIKKNGSTIATVTLTSGVGFSRIRAGETFIADSDAVTVNVSGAGTGAAGLIVQLRFG